MTNPWLQSLAARGKIDNIPLVKPSQMRMPHPEVGPKDIGKLSPTQRAAQKGRTGIASMLDQLFSGVPTEKHDMVMLLDLTAAANGEWCHGVWDMQTTG